MLEEKYVFLSGLTHVGGRNHIDAVLIVISTSGIHKLFLKNNLDFKEILNLNINCTKFIKFLLNYLILSVF